MKKRILVCGASGFIGRNIFCRLYHNSLENYGELELVGIFFKNEIYKAICGNLTIKNDVEKIFSLGWDCVIHAAAVTDGFKAVQANPAKYITDNIVMNSLIGEAVIKYNIPQLIFMSCTTVYPHFLDRPVNEKDVVFKPEDLHQYYGGAWVKLSAENIYRYFSALGNTKFTIIRHSNIYGPYDKFDLERGHVLAATIHKVMTAYKKITVLGEGKEKRDWLYISDLVDFIKIVMTNIKKQKPFEVYNVGLGRSISVKKMINTVISVSNRNDITVEYDANQPVASSNLVLDITKAKQLGWSPSKSLNEGIQLTIDWYKNNCMQK